MSTPDESLREDLNALLDGALPPDREAELRRRLEQEPELREEYESLKRTVEAVRGLPRGPAPAELRARVLNSLEQRRSPAPLLRWGAPLAAAAAVLVGLFLLDREGEKEPVVFESAKEETEGRDLAESKADDRRRPGLETVRDREAGERLEADEAELGARAPADPAPTRAFEQEREKELGRLEEAGAKKRAGKRKAEAKEQVRPEEEGLLDNVERGRAVKRSAYLAKLATMSASELKRHFAEYRDVPVPSTPRPQRESRQKSERALVAVTKANSFQEAKLIGEILRRAFPPRIASPEAARADESRAKQKGGEGAAAATVVGAGPNEMVLEVEATPIQQAQIHAFLLRISANAAGEDETLRRAVAKAPAVRTEMEPAGGPAARLRVRLRYPPERELAEPKAGEK